MCIILKPSLYLVSHFSCFLSKSVVFFFVSHDVFFVSQGFHMLQFLMRQFQLLLIVLVLFHLCFKVSKFLLNEKGKKKKRLQISKLSQKLVFVRPCILKLNWNATLAVQLKSERYSSKAYFKRIQFVFAQIRSFCHFPKFYDSWLLKFCHRQRYERESIRKSWSNSIMKQIQS